MDPSVLATTSTLTLAKLANPSHNSRVPRVHPSSRATTQEMLFRAQLEECHVLTPIPSSTQGIRSELNSRNTSKPTFQASLKAL